jgi:hypothetical protein
VVEAAGLISGRLAGKASRQEEDDGGDAELLSDRRRLPKALSRLRDAVR